MMTSQATCIPLQVVLTKLTDDEIHKHMCANIPSKPKTVTSPKIKLCTVTIRKLPLTYGQSVFLKEHTPSLTACSFAGKKPPPIPLKSSRKVATTCTFKTLKQHVHVFSVRRHILKKHHTKAYLKCRVAGCLMAYVTFHTVRNATAHHRLHHPAITYKCSSCAKITQTPNSLRLHMYHHRPKPYKCNVCDLGFVYQSKLKQHRRRHTKQKMYQCFHGGCNWKYRHPQDLTRHIKSHQQKCFECNFCDKWFAEKRLLKRHQVVHQSINVYFCKKLRARIQT